MWTDRTVGAHHQVHRGTLSVCSFLLALPYLSVCQLPGALLSAVEWSELGTYPVYILSHVRGYITHPWCCFKVLEAIPQISCGFCLLHCQYATHLTFINFVGKNTWNFYKKTKKTTKQQKHSILISLGKPVRKLPELLFGQLVVSQLKLKSSLPIKTNVLFI